MNKLIFNPKEDMKELFNYGFKYCIDGSIRYYELNLCESEIGFDGLIIDEDGTVNNYTNTNKSTLIFYKLIKANLIIDEEEYKNYGLQRI